MLSVPAGASRLVADSVSPEPDSGGSETEPGWASLAAVSATHFTPGGPLRSSHSFTGDSRNSHGERRSSNPVVGSPREQGRSHSFLSIVTPGPKKSIILRKRLKGNAKGKAKGKGNGKDKGKG